MKNKINCLTKKLRLIFFDTNKYLLHEEVKYLRSALVDYTIRKIRRPSFNKYKPWRFFSD